MAKPRSEREAIRREIMRFSNMGRFGDWVPGLGNEGAAKVYKLMAEDSHRAGYSGDEAQFMTYAIKLWPEVVNWTGRKDDPMVKNPEAYR